MNSPSSPVPAQPSFDILRPLATLPENNRGFEAIIKAPAGSPISDDPKFDVSVFDARPEAWRRSEVLGIVLGRTTVERTSFVREGVYVLPSVRAILSWGIGSVKFQAECDWLHGTQLAIQTQSLQLSARYLRNTLPWAPVIDTPDAFPSFKVSAGIGYGGTPHGAQYTTVAQLQNNGDFVDIPIPAFARSFTVLPIDNTAVLVQQMALGTAYHTDHVIAVPLSNAGQYNPIDQIQIWNGAELLRVTNTAGRVAIAMVIFQLQF